ncbi:YbjN domain-containing protein [Cellulomonas sp. NPDC089187]|uniref:YbjN domain-containing protein n=1 Tax=Cellulomonas sp. NPDC089187 TaxID=3154970 RepID=UPI0034199A11
MSSTGRRVTEHRIMTVLDRHGLHYGTDDDGRIGSFHAGHLFRIGCVDGALMIRTRWHRSVESGRAPMLHAVLRRWASEDERVQLTAVPWGQGLTVDAHCVSDRAGLTDRQIHRHLTTAMDGSLRAFGLLDRLLE